ncbi:hypothetical protein ES708_03713 [subsurface metagenome]
MKLSRIVRTLALSVILTLLIPLFPTPAHAAEFLFVFPYEGKIGDYFEIDGASFREIDSVHIYLSSQKAEIGDLIDEDVTAYEHLFTVNIDDNGSFERVYSFYLPDALTDGEDVEDVHSGDYYIYAVYYRSYQIAAVAEFIVLNGEISLDIEEDVVGTEVEISGIGLRPDQAITIKYDGNAIPISGGDSQSDDDGDFTCTLIIPESVAGSHVITAVDESGNTPETEFTVTPMITINPAELLTGGEAQVSGTGFAARGDITITIDSEEVTTTPLPLTADHYGSFEGSFIVPASGGFGDRTVEASDHSLNEAQAQIAIRGGIMVSPTTSLISPGYAGMELVINGAGFSIGSTVTITYSDNGEDIPVATATAKDGAFRVEFIVPTSAAGSHDITAADGTSTATVTFIMESQAPPTPTPLTPEVAGTTGARAHFDWLEVSDDSGISYTLQVAIDPDFNVILLNQAGLEASEYTLSEEEELASAQKDAPYYWRVKAVDGALNESGWTYPRIFYIGFSWSSLPPWALYVLGVVAAAVLGILGYWLWNKRARGKAGTA